MTPGLVKLKIASGKFRCSSRDRPRNYQNPPVTGNLTVFLLPVVGSSRERKIDNVLDLQFRNWSNDPQRAPRAIPKLAWK
ncbi:hypothetical protein BgiBS90_031809 [Biomphalaria glabrata]|nr:hypothetical protein BgiBS90_031809 [Biomphalaria glabrata]